jgi:hypothetical protein
MPGYLDAVLASRLMRGGYATVSLVSLVFLLGTAIRADEPLLSKTALVVGSATLAVICGWMAVAPGRERGRLALRGAGLMVGGVTCGLTVAGLGAFDPPRREFEAPSELPSLSNTAGVLQSSGFTDVSVTYPRSSPDTILVRYAGGPSLDQTDAAERVAGVVWTHEAVPFETVTVQAHGPSLTYSYSYQELADRFGPRPSELDALTIADVRTFGSIGVGIFEGLDETVRAVTHMAEFLCAGLIATLTLVGAALTGLRRPAELARR